MEKMFELLAGMCRFMIEKNASDMHLSVGVRPYIRVNGTIVPTALPVLSKEESEKLLFSIMSETQKIQFGVTKSVDFAFGEKGIGRFRINIYQQRGTIAAAIRRLHLDIPDFESLGLPLAPLKNLCNVANGLVLIAGPTGCGKTTTLAAMIDNINRTRACHIITLEDPIEYIHRDHKSLIHQREIGQDASSFSVALKFILREDPDVVLIGEMRDLETISSALTIAETGHLVLASLHTGDTIESIRRIVDVFPAGQQTQIIKQLSFTLVGVVNQLLLPSSDGQSRVLATELMLATPAIQNLIREYKIENIYSSIQMGRQTGMRTMNQALKELIEEGLISQETALTKATRPVELAKMLGGEVA